MEVLLLAFSCVAPFLAYLLLGYGSGKIFKINSGTFLDLNTLVFNIFLPLNLFFNIYNSNLKLSDLKSSAFLKPLQISIVGILIIFLVAMIYYGKRPVPKADKSVMIQSAFRSNFILFGIPLTENIMVSVASSSSEASAITSSGLGGVLTAIIIPVFNVLAVIVLSIYSKEKISFGRTLWRIVKNPLIIASVIAVGLRYFNFSLPKIALDILMPLGSLATPLALIALGGRFNFGIEKMARKLLLESLLLRLIVIPAIAVAATIALGIRGEALALLLVLFGGPVAVSSYTMAQQMGGNEKLAAQILVYTTIFSTLSLFLFISVLTGYSMF